MRTSLVQNGDEYIYHYGERNRLGNIYRKPEGETSAELYVEYTYDNNGNTISRTIYKSNDEIEIISFEYDGMNRLITTTKSLYPIDLEADPLSTEMTAYYYDNVGNRFIKQDDEGTTLYLRHGQIAVAMDLEMPADTGEGQGKVNRYILSGDLLAGRVTVTVAADGTPSSPEKSYYHLDHLNSTKAVAGSDGNLVVIYKYRAFGEQLKRLDFTGEETGDEARYSYGGKELDGGTNLYYFNARFYDAVIGRFINVDPMQDGSNWHVYCENNPLKFVDPTGLDAWKIDNECNDDYIQQYNDYVEGQIQEYEASGTKFTCEDLALSLLIDFAAANNLPVQITNNSGFPGSQKVYDAASKNFNSIDEFKNIVMKTTGANDLKNNMNTTRISNRGAGDIILLNIMNHTKIITGINFVSGQMDIAQGNLPPGYVQGSSSANPQSKNYVGTKIQRANYNILTNTYTRSKYTVANAFIAFQAEFRRWDFFRQIFWHISCIYHHVQQKSYYQPYPETEQKYIPRGQNDLQRIFKDHFEEFKEVYEDKYSKEYGKFRLDRITEVVEEFIKCGDYQEGVARIKCQNPDCGHDFFVPLSCLGFYLCPSCHQKRVLLFGEQISQEVLLRLPHKQFVFTLCIPGYPIS